ncbi:MAG: DUF5679 domain-containing protein [Candidatus Hodarchaeales archaeon]
MKCRRKVEIKNAIETKTKRGTRMYKGRCPNCETIVCRIG